MGICPIRGSYIDVEDVPKQHAGKTHMIHLHCMNSLLYRYPLFNFFFFHVTLKNWSGHCQDSGSVGKSWWWIGGYCIWLHILLNVSDESFLFFVKPCLRSLTHTFYITKQIVWSGNPRKDLRRQVIGGLNGVCARVCVIFLFFYGTILHALFNCIKQRPTP